MARERPFSLAYDQAVKEHLRAIDAKYHSLIRTTVEEQLRFEPETETRHRKPLQPPGAFGATWELRFGPDNRFRVLYAVDRDGREVQIQAIGVKERDQLTIGGEGVEFEDRFCGRRQGSPQFLLEGRRTGPNHHHP
jgi:hypothetical protein